MSKILTLLFLALLIILCTIFNNILENNEIDTSISKNRNLMETKHRGLKKMDNCGKQGNLLLQYNLLFINIPITGGNQLITLFKDLNNCDKVKSKFITYNNYLQTNLNLDMKSITAFTLVSNPYTRFIASYNLYNRPRKVLSSSTIEAYKDAFGVQDTSMMDVLLVLKFRKLLGKPWYKRAEKNEDKDVTKLYHDAPIPLAFDVQSMYTINDDNRDCYIIKNENFEKDFMHFLTKIMKFKEQDLLTFKKQVIKPFQPKIRKKIKEVLEWKHIEIINYYYEEDFLEFNYHMYKSANEYL